MNFEGYKNTDQKLDFSLKNLEIESDKETGEFISINKEDIAEIIQDMNVILGLEWDEIEDENILLKTFSDYEVFQSEKYNLGTMKIKIMHIFL